LKFKLRSDESRRKQIAEQALKEVRALMNAQYPVSLLFDKHLTSVERAAGEAWPQAMARTLGLNLQQLHDFCEGILKTGLWQSTLPDKPSDMDLLNGFRGWAALMLITEKELASGSQ
jgi:hypothetical protein